MEVELEWTEKVGAIHHARWMAAAIYVLKMTICGEERIKMSQSPEAGQRSFRCGLLHHLPLQSVLVCRPHRR